MTIAKATSKFNRCIEFTLSDGTTVTVKVLGDKVAAGNAAKLLLNALNATGTVTQ